MLEFQLRRIGAFGPEETISFHPNFDDNFKICECDLQMLQLYILLTLAVFHISQRTDENVFVSAIQKSEK